MRKHFLGSNIVKFLGFKKDLVKGVNLLYR